MLLPGPIPKNSPLAMAILACWFWKTPSLFPMNSCTLVIQVSTRTAFGANLCTTNKKANETTAISINKAMNLKSTRPMNIIAKQVANSTMAVLKSAGAINPQMMMIGRMMGMNALLKSLI